MDTRIYEPASGGKTTVFYFDWRGQTDPISDLTFFVKTDLFSDPDLTTNVTEDEFMDAYNSGAVLLSPIMPDVLPEGYAIYIPVSQVNVFPDPIAQKNIRVSTPVLSDETGDVAPGIYFNSTSTPHFDSFGNAYFPVCKDNSFSASKFYTSDELDSILRSGKPFMCTEQTSYGSFGFSTARPPLEINKWGDHLYILYEKTHRTDPETEEEVEMEVRLVSDDNLPSQ